MTQAALQLTGTVHIAPSADQLYDDLAHILVTASTRAVDERGVFHLALSGGSTPEPFYMRLIMDTRYRVIPWKQTHIWIVDERCVPADDDKSNFRMIREVLADHVPTRRRQIHPMPVLGDNPAAMYETELRRAIETSDADAVPRLDFVLLGMGDDGHTASLFPHSPALAEADKLIAVNAGPNVTSPDRVTMTFAMLNAARQVAVLVTGEKKAAALRCVDERLRASGPDSQNLPITGINPICDDDNQSALIWCLDAPAAGQV
jgi:6-phosphogluconolactonase